MPITFLDDPAEQPSPQSGGIQFVDDGSEPIPLSQLKTAPAPVAEPPVQTPASPTVMDYAKQAVGSVGRGVANTLAGTPQAIALGGRTLERAFPSLKALGESKGTESPLYKLGEGIQAAGQAMTPAEVPELRSSFWASKVPRGIGSALGFMLGGIAGKVAKVPAALSVAGLGAASSGVEGYKDAMASGASEDQALSSFLLNAGVGTTEAIPVATWLRRLDGMSGGSLAKALKNSARETLEEALQEAFQSGAGDVIAANIVKYDPERKLFANLAQDAAVGGVTGLLFSLASQALGAKLGKMRGQEQPVAGAETQPQPVTKAQPKVVSSPSPVEDAGRQEWMARSPEQQRIDSFYSLLDPGTRRAVESIRTKLDAGADLSNAEMDLAQAVESAFQKFKLPETEENNAPQTQQQAGGFSVEPRGTDANVQGQAQAGQLAAQEQAGGVETGVGDQLPNQGRVAPQAGQAVEPVLTPEAEQVLADADAGNIPLNIYKLIKIAVDNGIELTGQARPESVIAALQKLKAKKLKARQKQDDAVGRAPFTTPPPDQRSEAPEFLVEEYRNGYKLSSIKVPNEQRGKGVGKRLMMGLIQKSEQTGKPIYLTAVADAGQQENLNKFYERLGFQEWRKDPLSGKPMYRYEPKSLVKPFVNPTLAQDLEELRGAMGQVGAGIVAGNLAAQEPKPKLKQPKGGESANEETERQGQGRVQVASPATATTPGATDLQPPPVKSNAALTPADQVADAGKTTPPNPAKKSKLARGAKGVKAPVVKESFTTESGEPALPTKAVQTVITSALKSIDRITTGVPRKNELESAMVSLRGQAEKLGIEVPSVGTFFLVDEYRKIARNVMVAIGQKYGSHPTEAMRAERDRLMSDRAMRSVREKAPDVAVSDIGSRTKTQSPTPPPAAPVVESPKPSEPVPQAVAKVKSQVEKVAKTEGARPAKEIKSEVVQRVEDEINSLIAEAEANYDKLDKSVDGSRYQFAGIYADVEQNEKGSFAVTTSEYSPSDNGPGKRSKIKGTFKTLEEAEWFIKAVGSRERGRGRKVTFEIPGDGKFTVWRDGPVLAEMWQRASRLKTDSTGKPGKLPGGGDGKMDADAVASDAKRIYGDVVKAIAGIERQLAGEQEIESKDRDLMERAIQVLRESTPEFKRAAAIEKLQETIKDSEASLKTANERIASVRAAMKSAQGTAKQRNQIFEQERLIRNVEAQLPARRKELEALLAEQKKSDAPASPLEDAVSQAFPSATSDQVQKAIQAVKEADYKNFTTRAEAVQKAYMGLAIQAKQADPAFSMGPFGGLEAAAKLEELVRKNNSNEPLSPSTTVEVSNASPLSEKQTQALAIMQKHNGKSAFSALKELFDAGLIASPLNNQIVVELLKIGDLGVKLSVGGKYYSEQWRMEAAGLYDETTDTVNVYDIAFQNKKSIRTLLHEYTHALTLQALDNGQYNQELSQLFDAAWVKAQRDGLRFHGTSTYGQWPGVKPNLREFVAEAFSNPKFQDFLGRTRSPLKGKLQSLWDSFIQLIGKMIGVKPSSALADVLRIGGELIKARANAPAQIKMSSDEGDILLPADSPEAQGMSAPVTHEVNSVEFKFDGADKDLQPITPERMQAAVLESINVLTGLAIPGQMVATKRGSYYRFESGFGNLDAEFLKLLDYMRTKMPQGWQNPPEELAPLVSWIRQNYALGNMENVVSPRVADMLMREVSPYARRIGQMLNALSQTAIDLKDIGVIGRNIRASLTAVYWDIVGGDGIDQLLNRVLTIFKDSPEFENAKQKLPELEAYLRRVQEANTREAGGRVYRWVQSQLKPKRARKLAPLEQDAMVEEAAREILQQAKALGIEPKVAPNKQLTALQKLALVVTEETSAKIMARMEQAVEDAQYNAGWKIMERELGEEEAYARKAAGEQPDPEAVEKGLALPEFAHWKVIRDNLMGYNPITVKLAQDVVKGSFKGAKFSEGKPKPADVRIDLNKLATAPQDEVKRVMDAFLENVRGQIDLSRATPETLRRVEELVRQEVIGQLEQARARYRDPFFRQPVKPGERLTPEQQLGKAINAGLFADERLDVPAYVDAVAGKGAIRRLLPTYTELVKQILETPFYRMDELRSNWVRQMVDKLGLTEDQAANAWKVFEAAHAKKLAEARVKAAKKTLEALTQSPHPDDAAIAKQLLAKKGGWERLLELVRAHGFDAPEAIRKIAELNGLKMPSEAEAQKIRELVEQEEKLLELTPAQKARIEREYPTLEERQKATERELSAVETLTNPERTKIRKEVQARWTRYARPLKFMPSPEAWRFRQNNVAAAVELSAANLLDTITFFTHQAIQITSIWGPNTVLNGVSSGILKWNDARAQAQLSGQPAPSIASMWDEVLFSWHTGMRAQLQYMKPAINEAWAAWRGRGEGRNIEHIISGIAAFERAEVWAKEQEAQGNRGRAQIKHFLRLLQTGFRFAQALDFLHGTPQEMQRLATLADRALAKQGFDRGQRKNMVNDVIGSAKANWNAAMAMVNQMVQDMGIEMPPQVRRERAALLAKQWAYERAKQYGLPADLFQAEGTFNRNTIGWNEAETRGIGAPIAVGLRGTQKAVAELFGVPIAIGNFSNAVATSINRLADSTILGLLGNFDIIGKVTGRPTPESPWWKFEQDKMNRKVAFAIGTGLGSVAFLLAATGLVTVQMFSPKDPEERKKWYAQGHKPGTLEFYNDDGTFTAVSIAYTPLIILTPYFAAGWAWRQKETEREKAQQQLNEQAAKMGVEPGRVPGKDLGDLLGIAANTAYATILGGSRTAAGVLGTFTDQARDFNLTKFAASQVSPFIPAMPLGQMFSRWGNVQLDSKLASFWDFLLPLPTSQARLVNMLGDPIGTPDAFQRVMQSLTGGTYFGVNPVPQGDNTLAYQSIFASGWRPPGINPNRGYVIDGKLRRMTDEELANYTVTRGKNLAAELNGMGYTEDPAVVKAAYERANSAALSDVGAMPLVEYRNNIGGTASGEGQTGVGSLGSARMGQSSGGWVAGVYRSNLARLRKGASPTFARLALGSTAPRRSAIFSAYNGSTRRVSRRSPLGRRGFGRGSRTRTAGKLRRFGKARRSNLRTGLRSLRRRG